MNSYHYLLETLENLLLWWVWGVDFASHHGYNGFVIIVPYERW